METINLQYSSSSGPEGVGFVAGAGDGRRVQAHRESGSYVEFTNSRTMFNV